MSVDVFARLGFAVCVLFEWCSGCLGVLFVMCIIVGTFFLLVTHVVLRSSTSSIRM